MYVCVGVWAYIHVKYENPVPDRKPSIENMFSLVGCQKKRRKEKKRKKTEKCNKKENKIRVPFLHNV